MTHHLITINQDFNAPAATVFPMLADHEGLGKYLNARIKRIRDGRDNVNGVGSVRRIYPLFVALKPGSVDETVTTFEPNSVIEYTVTRGGPLKNHLGRMVFKEQNGKTHLHYTIQFESAIPFAGPILKVALDRILSHGIGKMSKQFQ